LVCAELAQAGVEASLEPFRGPSSFAWAQATAPALSLLGWRKSALVLGALENDQRFEPLSRLLSLADSQNVVASVPASGEEQRTLVLVSHLDSSRSGILFHPEVAPQLRKLTTLISAAVAARAVRVFERTSKAILVAGLALLAEREILGADVPGANDNASGVGVATALAREFALAPLEATRVVFLATGCEESGTGGMRAFLDAHRGEWEDWLFLNLDGVGAPATLRYLPREGILRIFGADPALIDVCEKTALDHPELGLRAAGVLAGLTYDATPVMARGGRAITVSAQDRTIPNYHSAQDVPENLDGDVLARALEATRLVAAAIDRGEADR
jgi:hypothetical protein